MAGDITNRSDSTWTDLKVYLLTSSEPFTTGDELTSASQSDPTQEVGARITGEGLYEDVGELEPGESTSYLLSVPRGDLGISGASGVYWLGVHVLGSNEDGRDGNADGRARTFLPLMQAQGPRTTVSLVVPVKAPVRRRSDGRLYHLRRWQRDLGPDGRLDRLFQLTSTATDQPVTLVTDPAVVDAARSVAADNPPINTAPTDGGNESGPTESPSQSPSAESSPSPSTEEPDPGGDGAELSPEAEDAADWVRLFQDQAEQHEVLAVPYGDADVASMLRSNFPDLYRDAVDLGTATMEDVGIEASPVVAPAGGYLPNQVLPKLDPDTALILGDGAAPEAERSVIQTRQGQDAVIVSSAASGGGPLPTRAFGALAMRQRILSEAAVHALTGAADQPLVASTPQSWNPGSDWRSAQFFTGFDVPWLRVEDLGSVTAAAGVVSPTDKQYDVPLIYPRRERRAEIPMANLLVTDELRTTGKVFANLLTRNDSVDKELGKAALLASSLTARAHPHRALVPVRRTSEGVRSLMARVRIDGSPFITMSSEEGTFIVKVINDLEEPVTVGIRANTGDPALKIEETEPVSLGPGQRASVRLRATSTNIGVYSVTLVATTRDGEPVGSATKFSVRSSQVGLVVWVIMGVGAAVFVVTAGFRIARRVRERRSSHEARIRSEHT